MSRVVTIFIDRENILIDHPGVQQGGTMGLYFNKPDTVKLCAKLNRRFSDQNLDDIRTDPDRLAKFLNPAANARTLQRIGDHP